MASVRERESKSGERSYSVLYRQGKTQKSLSFSTFKQADDLADMMNRHGVEKALKMSRESASGRDRGVTLDAIAERWFAYKSRDLSKRGLEDYRRDYRNWIGPFL